uniref:Uncharacterized protein n=1 Tax=Arundo donax TaxID=35708 RepID=A0A0A8ZGU0_ARUDO
MLYCVVYCAILFCVLCAVVLCTMVSYSRAYVTFPVPVIFSFECQNPLYFGTEVVFYIYSKPLQ